jgi:hypothetical protein
VTRSSVALMEGGGVLGAREQARVPFYRRLGWKREARRVGLRLEVAGGGEEEPGKLGGDRGTGGGAAVPQAAWRVGKAPAGGARAVEGQWDDAWTREEQEMGAGDQGRFTTPAAEAPGGQSRGTEAQGGRRGKE